MTPFETEVLRELRQIRGLLAGDSAPCCPSCGGTETDSFATMGMTVPQIQCAGCGTTWPSQET